MGQLRVWHSELVSKSNNSPTYLQNDLPTYLLTYLPTYLSLYWLPLVDGGNTLLSGSTRSGDIAIWDLDARRLENVIRDAHISAVNGMEFLPQQPILITSSKDNSIRVGNVILHNWSFFISIFLPDVDI